MSGVVFYGFDGKQISSEQWTRIIQSRGQTVSSSMVRGQGRTYWVSTVLLGLDYSWGNGRPLIFETMVFEQAPGGIREVMSRYHTIEQARRGHTIVVRGMRQMLKEQRRMYPPLLHNGRKP